MSNALVLYDGVCGLCNGLTSFLLRRDRRDRLRFASLQSDVAAAILSRYGKDSRDLDTVYVVKGHGEPSERLLARSDAILELGRQLGGPWRLVTVGRLLPRVVRDGLYQFVARYRYRVFGQSESCVLPLPHHRSKFIDIEPGQKPNEAQPPTHVELVFPRSRTWR